MEPRTTAVGVPARVVKKGRPEEALEHDRDAIKTMLVEQEGIQERLRCIEEKLNIKTDEVDKGKPGADSKLARG